jgi:hypothetical protein
MTLYQRSQPDIYTPRFTRVLVSSSVSLDEIISHSPSLSCVVRDRVCRNVRSDESKNLQADATENIVIWLHGQLRGNGWVNAIPRQRIGTQQSKALLETVFSMRSDTRTKIIFPITLVRACLRMLEMASRYGGYIANILNEQSRTADKGCSSDLVAGCRDLALKRQSVMKCYTGPQTSTYSLERT